MAALVVPDPAVVVGANDSALASGEGQPELARLVFEQQIAQVPVGKGHLGLVGHPVVEEGKQGVWKAGAALALGKVSLFWQVYSPAPDETSAPDKAALL